MKKDFEQMIACLFVIGIATAFLCGMLLACAV